MGGGPSQPEVQGFQPAGADDLVDLFTGDFSYNIPLLDVEGYPVNLSYRAGLNMDQEASWVGLGWNINPGVVERNVRGLPDDFAGDDMVNDMAIRPNWTAGLSLGGLLEVFGKDDLVRLNGSGTISLNNYMGLRFETNVGLSMRSATQGKSAYTAGLGLTSGSNSGLKLQPKVGYERITAENDQDNFATGGLNFGVSIDSRKGLTDMSFGVYTKATHENCGGSKVTYKEIGEQNASSSYNFGIPTYTPKIDHPMDNASISLNFTLGSEILGVHPGTRFGGFFSYQKLREQTTRRHGYGYLYLERARNDQDGIMDINREKDGPYDASQSSLPIAQLTNDIYVASGQGIGGSYRPFRAQVGTVRDGYNACGGRNGTLGLEIGAGGVLHGGSDILLNSLNSWSGEWKVANRTEPRLRFSRRLEDPAAERVFFREANEAVVDMDEALFNGFGGAQAERFTMEKQGSGVRLLAELNHGPHVSTTIPMDNFRHKREPRAQVFSYLTVSDVRQGLGLQDREAVIHRRLGQDLTARWEMIPDHHLAEISIHGKSGERYVYGLPVYNTRQEDVTFAVAPLNDEEAELISYAAKDNSVKNEVGRDRLLFIVEDAPLCLCLLAHCGRRSGLFRCGWHPGPQRW
ncbi:MAG: hypothetical protein QM724_13400 [Flavobacteriales bacterium]